MDHSDKKLNFQDWQNELNKLLKDKPIIFYLNLADILLPIVVNYIQKFLC